jgi:hypothetical protein
MKVIACLISLLFASVTCAAQAQVAAADDKNPYPNELPTLKLYRDAKWKSLRPYISTEEDIQKVLGTPARVYNQQLRTDVAGYDGDSDWTIFVPLVGEGGDLPDSVVDRLDEIVLYPKRRVSLIGADFSAFSSNSVLYHSDAKTTVYSDRFGLRYVVYAEDATDGSFHTGDLKLIEYGASEDERERLTRKPNAQPNKSLGPKDR